MSYVKLQSHVTESLVSVVQQIIHMQNEVCILSEIGTTAIVFIVFLYF